MRTAGLLAALALASAVGAQTVTLGGWGVPPGMAVCGSSGVVTYNQVFDVGGTDTVSTEGSIQATVCWSAFDVRDGRVVGADETLVDWYAEEHLEGDPAGRSMPHPANGLPLRLTLGPDETWTARPRDREPTADEADYLAGTYTFELATEPPYPHEPVAVGDEWDVAFDALNVWRGPLDETAENVYRVRLDSLGVLNGRQVAFLTETAAFTDLRSGGPTRFEQRWYVALDLETKIVVASESSGTRDFSWESGPVGSAGRTQLLTWIDARTERGIVPEGEAPVGPSE